MRREATEREKWLKQARTGGDYRELSVSRREGLGCGMQVVALAQTGLPCFQVSGRRVGVARAFLQPCPAAWTVLWSRRRVRPARAASVEDGC